MWETGSIGHLLDAIVKPIRCGGGGPVTRVFRHRDGMSHRQSGGLASCARNEFRGQGVPSVRCQADVVRHAHWYMLGTGLALWSGWQGSTALGITLGPRIPDTWQLDFALPLTFVARLIPSLRDRPGLAAALCGAVLAVFLDGLPYRLGLISVAAI